MSTSRRAGRWPCACVPPSVMPKGVEHLGLGETEMVKEWEVPPSVMPKGVEHIEMCGFVARSGLCRPP